MSCSPCEVRDYVVDPGGVRTVRQLNEASNRELLRRRDPFLAQSQPSGELAPYAIAWVNTCGGEVIEPGV